LSRRAVFWYLVALVVIVVTTYAPALRAGFIWDDDAHLTAPALRSMAGLWRIWSDVHATQQYYPLLHSVFWLEHRAWGGAALGYHLTNVLLHVGVAAMLYCVLRRLQLRGAALAALLFALHPVHVESVAWISEQKNTLSTLLYLAAAFCYLRFDSTRAPRAYSAAAVFFVLALLAKSVTATLPAALLVVFWWRRGTLGFRRDVVPLLPWFVFGAAAGLFTAWIEHAIIGARSAAFELGLVERALLAGHVVWFYLGKLLWPANLTFIYPRWEIDASAPLDWAPLAALVLLFIILWRFRHTSRAPLAVGLLYVGTLFPVLGFFNIYPFQYSFVADHFQYLASLAVFASLASLLHRLLGQTRGPLVPLLTSAGVAALALLTSQQTRSFHDNRTLFRATLARNSTCWMAHNNLGKELLGGAPELPTAIAHFRRAIALRPDYAEAHNNLGLALTQSARPHEAIPHLERSLALKPNSYQAHNNLGIALASSGRAAEAVQAFARAVELNPNMPNLHENWAKALRLLGREAEAQARFAVAARLRENASAP
jgi:protein O-mannosyl-transferase